MPDGTGSRLGLCSFSVALQGPRALSSPRNLSFPYHCVALKRLARVSREKKIQRKATLKIDLYLAFGPEEISQSINHKRMYSWGAKFII